jgi:hypothetical protein
LSHRHPARGRGRDELGYAEFVTLTMAIFSPAGASYLRNKRQASVFCCGRRGETRLIARAADGKCIERGVTAARRIMGALKLSANWDEATRSVRICDTR